MTRLQLSFSIIAITSLAIAAPAHADEIRFATFNVSLYRSQAGELAAALRSGDDPQISKVAEIIQRVDPDVILLTEFDYDPEGKLPGLFRENYLQVSQHGQKPVRYEHVFSGPVNTGVDSGFDLDRDGVKRGAGDAWGFGRYEGQYGMLVLSKQPILGDQVRTFQHFLWKDMPSALLPDDPATAAEGDWYSKQVLGKFPLSSKSHWDVPIRIGGRVIHLLASHPTPPVFDGAEDRNGRRNHDEIRFWRDYITPESGGYIYDDDGRRGGLAAGASFVIAGDLNCDPHDGDSTGFPIRLLLDSKRVGARHVPASGGAEESSRLNRNANQAQRGDPRHDTGEYASMGNLRLDYVLPSNDLKVAASGVYWPVKSRQYEAKLADEASDHRLVWVDLTLD